MKTRSVTTDDVQTGTFWPEYRISIYSETYPEGSDPFEEDMSGAVYDDAAVSREFVHTTVLPD